MPQPSGQVLVDSGHSLAGTLFAYAHDNGGGGGLWDATSGAMLTKVGTGAVATEGGATVVTSAGTTYYTLPSSIVMNNAQAFSVGFRCRATAANAKTMVMGLTTSTTSYVWLNHTTGAGNVRISGSTNWAANGGVTNMTTWWITKGAGTSTGRVYKDGVLIGTLANAAASLTVNAILKGYNSTTFDFDGALEFAHIIAGVELTSTEVESLTADPYQVLESIGGVDADVAGNGAMAWGATGAIDASGVAPLSADVAGSGAMSWSAAGAASATITSGTITLTAPAAYRMHQRNVATNTASVTISGTYTGSPGSIQYRFAGGAWQTLVASPAGGAFSQAVTLPTGQGAIEVRFSSDTGVTASRALVGVGDVYVVAGQSNHVGAASQTVAPTPGAFTAVQLDSSTSQWKPLQEGLTQATSFSGQSGYGGSYIGALSNRLQSNGVPVAFIPVAKGSTRIDQWQRYDPDPTNPYWNYGGMLGKWNAAGGGRAMLWWQGESDASNGTAAATFESLTNEMINDWMADTGTPVFMVKITNFHANAPTIRSSQDAIASGNANVIGIADGGGAYSGDVHYLTATQINAVADAVYTPFEAAFYPDGATVAAAGAGAMSWAASGAVSASVIPLPIAAAVAGAAAMAWAAQAGVSVTAVDPAATQVDVSAGAAMSWAAAGAVSASILPPVAADVQGAAAMAWSATGYVYTSDGSIVWPATRAGEANTARVPFDGVRVIVPDADDPASPVKAVPLYVADTERILVDWEAKYLPGAGDTAATVLALDAPAGVSVTPSVAPGAALTTGVVVLAVTPTGAAGTYRVALRISTAGGRESTALVDVVVSATVPSAKTFRLRSTADRDVFDLDYAAKYLAGAADVADVLLSTSADAGLAADARLDVGGVVQVAVDNPAAPGTYQVRTQLQTAAGRRKTGAIDVEVLA